MDESVFDSAPAELPEDDQPDSVQAGVMPSTGFVPFIDAQQQRQQQAVLFARSRQRARLFQRLIIYIIFMLSAFEGFSFFVPSLSQKFSWLSSIRSLVSLLNNAPVLKWQPVFGWSPLLAAAYFVLICVLFLAISLPFNWYTNFFAPRRYGLLKGRTRDWLILYGMGSFISLFQIWLFIEVATLLITIQPQTWWVWVTLIQFFFSLLETRFASPRIFDRLNTVEPLSNAELNGRFHELLACLHIPACGVFVVNISHRSNAVRSNGVNAYQIGWGRARRVVLTDTLVQNFPLDEIEVFLVLELGHLVHHTIWKSLSLNMLVFLCLYYETYLALNLFVDAGSSVLFTRFLTMVAILILLLVISSLTQRYFRHQRYLIDEFALQSTGKVQAFKDAITRMAYINLQVAASSSSPSYPFLASRLQHADDFDARNAPLSSSSL